LSTFSFCLLNICWKFELVMRKIWGSFHIRICNTGIWQIFGFIVHCKKRKSRWKWYNWKVVKY
jgi:hypothetical protein